MITKKESITILLLSIILGAVLSNFQISKIFWYSCLSVLIIFLVNILAKKIAGYYFESDVKISLWELKRYGFRPEHVFRKAIPAGVIFPILLKILSLGYLNWTACFSFDVDAKVSRAARRHDIYTFSELSEYHLGVIAAWGIAANLIVAVIAYLIGFPKEMDFVKLSLYYSLFNMIPFSDLDGNKIFFGSIILWSFLAAILLLSVLFSFWII